MNRVVAKKLCGVLHRVERMSARLRQNLEDKAVWYSRADRAVLARNRDLRDRHRGRRCFVIGNGPSLRAQNLGVLRGELTFAMSGFWKHPVVAEWQPSYYCFADQLFFDGSAPMAEFFQELRQRVRRSTFLLPLLGRERVLADRLVGEGGSYYVAFQGALERTFIRSLDLTRPIPGVESVAQLAIMVAIYAGCSPIYLMGLDHDWLAARGREQHFYEGTTVAGHAHAHGDLARIPYKVDLMSSLRLWRGYERLQVIAERNGCAIHNATRGGFLDVFPRVAFETLTASANQTASN